jgi:hypothetical protein
MNDWDLPNSEARLVEEIEYYDRKAREMRMLRDPHGMRMERMYRDLASHRRRLLTGLTSNKPVAETRPARVFRNGHG